jgi:hypothetical protein
MSDRHEQFLADLIGGRRCPGSGNQSANQLDVRNDPTTGFAFGLDGKSTLGRSLSLSETTWAKVVDQSHGLRPGMALRWYHDWRLRSSTDLIVISTADFSEMLEIARGQ